MGVVRVYIPQIGGVVLIGIAAVFVWRLRQRAALLAKNKGSFPSFLHDLSAQIHSFVSRSICLLF
jgi:hypothetical protein